MSSLYLVDVVVVFKLAIANSFLEGCQGSMSISDACFRELGAQTGFVSSDCEFEDMVCSGSDTTFRNEEVVCQE
jgi:hypothetical protein